MYIIVTHPDDIIIGTATRPVNAAELSKNGYKVFEIDDKDFSVDMIGSKLTGFDEVK